MSVDDGALRCCRCPVTFNVGDFYTYIEQPSEIDPDLDVWFIVCLGCAASAAFLL